MIPLNGPKVGKALLATGFLLALLLCLLLAGGRARAKTITVDDDGGEDHTTIQEAVDTAEEGDLILVKEGNYEENIVVDKTVQLQGNGPESTIIDGRREGDAIRITANGVSVSGFGITRGYILGGGPGERGSGINITSSNCLIQDNVLSDCDYGVLIKGGDNNTISDNEFFDNWGTVIALERTTGNILEGNSYDRQDNLQETYRGIELSYSNANIITGNTFRNISNEGVILLSSNDNLITGNSFCLNDWGIYISSSSGNQVEDNNCSLNTYGIRIGGSWRSGFVNNSCYRNTRDGIYARHLTKSELLNNRCLENGLNGIVLTESAYYLKLAGNVMEGSGFQIDPSLHYADIPSGNDYLETLEIDDTNTVDGRKLQYLTNETDLTIPGNAAQIFLVNCSGITVEDQDCSDTASGLLILRSNNVTVVNCRFERNRKYGIYLRDSRDCEIKQTSSSGNTDGILLTSSHFNTINENTFTDNADNGLSLVWASSNIITENTISRNSYHGINLTGSRSNIFRSNILEQNGFFLSWSTALSNWDLEYWTSNSLDASNTVNGLPLHFLVGEENLTFSSKIGQILLVNCRNVTLENQNLGNQSAGLMAAYSTGIVVRDSSFADSSHSGILLREASEVRITRASITDNGEFGIRLYSSSSVSITNSSIMRNGDGVFASSSRGIRIENNTISGNGCGIFLWGETTNNSANHNRILENREHGIFAGSSGVSGMDDLTSPPDYSPIDATCNYWGSDTGPYNWDTNRKGKGDNVSGLVEFSPWLDSNGKEIYHVEDDDDNNGWLVLLILLLFLPLVLVLCPGDKTLGLTKDNEKKD